MHKIVLLFFVFLFLNACGGGGSSNTNAPKPLPYQTVLVPEKTFTTDRWNQTNQKSAFGDGVYLVVFVDDRENLNSLSGEDIWGVLLDGGLNVIAEFPIVHRVGRDIEPFVVFDNDSRRFLVAWTAYSGGSILEFSQIMTAFVTPDGKVMQNQVVNTAKGSAELTGLKKVNGGFAFLFKDTWLTYDSDIGSKVLKVAVTDSNLNPLKVYAITDDSYAGVKVDPTGSAFDCIGSTCLVAYSMGKEILRDHSLHIYFRLLSLSDGSLQPETRVSDEAYGKAASKAAPIVSAGKDSFLVAWRDFDSEQGLISVDLVGKFVNQAGAVTGQAILISDFRWDKNAPIKSGLGGSVFYAAISYRRADDTFYAVWSDSRSGTPLDTGIFMRRIGKDKDCILVNNMPQDQKTPNLVEGKDGKMFLTWTQSGVRQAHGYFSADIFGLYSPF